MDIPALSRPTPCASLLAAALALAFPAFAQQSAPKADGVQPAGEQKIQKVEVRGTAGSYDPRRDDTATKTVVSQEEIAKYGDTSVVGVLKRVPGITVKSPNGRGGEIRMRGLGAGHTPWSSLPSASSTRSSSSCARRCRTSWARTS